jgi:hypothetical protein
MTTQLAIGKTNYKGGSAGGGAALPEKLVYYKLGHKAADGKDRVIIVRLAPPIGPLAEKGVWRRFMKQHFGYGITVVTQGGDKRFIPQTFLCIEETDRDGNIKVQCPECNEIKLRKAKRDSKEAELKAQGKTEEEIDMALKHVKSWLREHNVDKKWWANAKDLSGKWGILTISYSSMKLYLDILKALTEKNFDPLGPDKGVWFKFTRSGNSFNDIKDIPTVHMDEQTDGSFRIKYDALTESDLAQLAALPPLTEHGRVLTYDQIDELVKSGGDEAVVRTVMNLPVNNTRAPEAGGKLPEPTKPATEPAPTQAATTEDDEVARLQAALAAAQSKKNKPEPKQATPGPAATPKLQSQMDMPMDDFLAQFEK